MQTETHEPYGGIAPATLAAFYAVATEVVELEDEDLITIGADVPTSVYTALAVADRIVPLHPKMREGNFDMELILKLSTYAWAAHYTHLVWEGPKSPMVMITDATRHRRQLLASAEALLAYDLVEEQRVAAARGGHGHAALANSLMQLAGLFTEVWAKVEGKTAVTQEAIKQAGRLGEEIHRRLAGARSEFDAVDPTLTAKAARERAWTLLVNAYSETRRAVTAVRWYEGDADEIAPSLYTRTRRVVEEEPEPDEPVKETEETATEPGSVILSAAE